MGKVFFNMSMTNGKASGVEIYSIKLKEKIEKSKHFESVFLFIRKTKFLSFYRIFWNFFILPIKAKNNLVYSFSTHGSPFLSNQIITIHDLICLNYPKQNKLQYYYFKYLVPSILKSSKKIVAISEFTKSDLLKFYSIPERKIEVVYNGLNHLKLNNDFKTNSDYNRIVGDSPFFLTVGASYPHKNVENLFHAIKLFNNNEIKFFIIGKKNDYGVSLRKLSEKLELSNVIFLDYVSESLLAKLYKETICNIYISSYEGFGFPPLEAACFGTTSLVSDIPIMHEILGEYAIYVDSKNIEKITQKITNIYSNKINGTQTKKDFKALLRKYSWENASGKIINLINENL